MDKELFKYEDQIYAQLNDNITAYVKKFADVQNMVSDLKAIAEEKNRYVASLENENKEYLTKIEYLDSEAENNKKKLAEYEKEKAFFDDLKADSLNLAALIREENSKIEELAEKKQEYEEAKNEIVTLNQRLKSDLDKKTDEYIKLDQKYNSQVAEYRNKEQEIDKKNIEIISINKEKKGLKDNIAELQEKIQKLENEKNKLIENNNDLKKQNDELSKKLSEASDNNEFTEQMKQQIEEQKSLEKDIEWLKGYAKATDEKVKKYFQGDKRDLDAHNHYLLWEPKDDKYNKFFPENNEVKKEIPKIEEKQKPEDNKEKININHV